MSFIKFNKSDEIIEVSLFMDSGRVKITFINKENIPDKSILFEGFHELNEHNFIEQSDFSNMNFLYRKLDELTYILTNDENDTYKEPDLLDENYSESITEEHIPTTDEVRNTKILNLSFICNAQIVNGIDIEIDGTIEHFSYAEEDQTNIKELFDLAVQTNVPLYYHSDGNSCKLYTVKQIIELYTSAAMNKMHHITYFNQLKMYLNTLNDCDEIYAVEYGIPLQEEFLEVYNAAMTQARLGMETLLMVSKDIDMEPIESADKDRESSNNETVSENNEPSPNPIDGVDETSKDYENIKSEELVHEDQDKI